MKREDYEKKRKGEILKLAGGLLKPFLTAVVTAGLVFGTFALGGCSPTENSQHLQNAGSSTIIDGTQPSSPVIDTPEDSVIDSSNTSDSSNSSNDKEDIIIAEGSEGSSSSTDTPDVPDTPDTPEEIKDEDKIYTTVNGEVVYNMANITKAVEGYIAGNNPLNEVIDYKFLQKAGNPYEILFSYYQGGKYYAIVDECPEGKFYLDNFSFEFNLNAFASSELSNNVEGLSEFLSIIRVPKLGKVTMNIFYGDSHYYEFAPTDLIQQQSYDTSIFEAEDKSALAGLYMTRILENDSSLCGNDIKMICMTDFKGYTAGDDIGNSAGYEFRIFSSDNMGNIDFANYIVKSSSVLGKGYKQNLIDNNYVVVKKEDVYNFENPYIISEKLKDDSNTNTLEIER